MKNILITGGKGQLASCIKDISGNAKDCNFFFVDIEELDITKTVALEVFFNKNKITHCINCAAYTAVDKAESDKVLANQINVVGAKNLALVCARKKTILIHISTDFVFDGEQTTLYSEKDQENPLGVYGKTKLLGEKAITAILKEHFIIRTSWLYSEHGHNFLKTMLRLGKEKNELNVVADQIGTPTYAGDLANLLLNIIRLETIKFGTYHYSNEGVASWYDFAQAIFDQSNSKVNLTPIKTEAYPTAAQRPRFSVMDKTKSKEILKIKIPHWTVSLKKCLNKITIEE